MQLPLVQKYAERILMIAYRFSGGGYLAEAHRACDRYAPKVKNSLPKICRTRERGARECRRLRCLERAP
jgi:hypothetical protein